MSGLHTGEIEFLARQMLSDVTPNESIVSIRAYRSPVHWLGVFASDQLPDLRDMQRPFALVFNTDSSNKPGQHWLSIFGPNEGPLSSSIRLACLHFITKLLLHSLIYSLVFSHIHLICVVITLSISFIIGHVIFHLPKLLNYSNLFQYLIHMSRTMHFLYKKHIVQLILVIEQVNV